MSVAAIILAAGKGTRMKSDLVKVMHPLGERPMLSWPVQAAKSAGAELITLVVGHQEEKVKEFFGDDDTILFARQADQLGTGHAVLSARPVLEGFSGTIMILCGDAPLIKASTLQAMLLSHLSRGAVISVLTTHLKNPYGYGRIIKREGSRITRIVEERDATSEEREILEINSGIYCVASDFLFKAVSRLKNDNLQKEYYLTDIIKEASLTNQLCLAYSIEDSTEVMGVNDRQQLAVAAAALCRRINNELMLDGVTLIDPATTYIESGVVIGRDSTIYPNVHIYGKTVIGSGTLIEPGVVIRDCRIGDKVIIKAGSVLTEAEVGDDSAVGPMAHLRPGSRLGAHVKIGNFVETKKIVMGEGSKASHLTYLGDAEIGRDVNIGCGTITCNYDGVNKHKTVIGDRVFVGSDVQLVAPVTVGAGSLIAAGTTVTKDVPPDSLVIARSPQINKEGWVKKRALGSGQ